MSFEETKERLVREFTETQAAIRAEFNMKKPAPKPLSNGPEDSSGEKNASSFRSAG